MDGSRRAIVITGCCRIDIEANLVTLRTGCWRMFSWVPRTLRACTARPAGRRHGASSTVLGTWVTLHWSFCAQLLGGASVHSHFKSKASVHSVSVSWLSFSFQSRARMLRRRNSVEEREEFSGLRGADFSSCQGQPHWVLYWILFLSVLSCVRWS